MTDKLALAWLRNYFDVWTREQAAGEPRLLLLDGHRTYYSLAFVRYAVQQRSILLSYPGHSAHLLQPLDVCLFAPLKRAYGDAVYEHTHDTIIGVTKRLS